MRIIFTYFVIILLLVSCRDPKVQPPENVIHEWHFEHDAQGWEGNFADYPAGQEEFFELHFDYSPLPAPLDSAQGALMLSGTNRSDDLFMFVTRRITGLLPENVYHVNFTVRFASDVPDGMAGIGGSPGESVYIKAGAVSAEPGRLTDEMGYYRMDIDKGNQSQGGSDMIVIGDFSNDASEQEYILKTVTNAAQGFSVQSNEAGELWIIIGTDSGFEGNTTIYFSMIQVELVY